MRFLYIGNLGVTILKLLCKMFINRSRGLSMCVLLVYFNNLDMVVIIRREYIECRNESLMGLFIAHGPIHAYCTSDQYVVWSIPS